MKEKTVHKCPGWCHACPLMPGGAVMPMCLGVVMHYVNEYDISSCTCDPSDPAVAQMRAVEHAALLLEFLRDKRRNRRLQKTTLKQLADVVKTMPFWRHDDMRRNAKHVESLVYQLCAAQGRIGEEGSDYP